MELFSWEKTWGTARSKRDGPLEHRGARHEGLHIAVKIIVIHDIMITHEEFPANHSKPYLIGWLFSIHLHFQSDFHYKITLWYSNLALENPLSMEISSDRNITELSMVHGFQPAMFDDIGGYIPIYNPYNSYVYI